MSKVVIVSNALSVSPLTRKSVPKRRFQQLSVNFLQILIVNIYRSSKAPNICQGTNRYIFSSSVLCVGASYFYRSNFLMIKHRVLNEVQLDGGLSRTNDIVS